MILTPKQLEQLIAQGRENNHIDLGWFDNLVDGASDAEGGPQDLADTLTAYAEIVQKVAEAEPWEWAGYDGDMQQCFYCGVWEPNVTDIVHEPDCLYLAARKVRGL